MCVVHVDRSVDRQIDRIDTEVQESPRTYSQYITNHTELHIIMYCVCSIRTWGQSRHITCGVDVSGQQTCTHLKSSTPCTHTSRSLPHMTDVWLGQGRHARLQAPFVGGATHGPGHEMADLCGVCLHELTSVCSDVATQYMRV